MYCSDCGCLLGEYARLTRAHSAAYRRASESMSNSDAPEYAELKNAADQIRATLELARFEFERHKVIHQADANTRTYAGYTSLWRWRICGFERSFAVNPFEIR